MGLPPDPPPKNGAARPKLVSQSLLHDIRLPHRGVSPEGGPLRQTVRYQAGNSHYHNSLITEDNFPERKLVIFFLGAERETEMPGLV